MIGVVLRLEEDLAGLVGLTGLGSLARAAGVLLLFTFLLGVAAADTRVGSFMGWS